MAAEQSVSSATRPGTESRSAPCDLPGYAALGCAAGCIVGLAEGILLFEGSHSASEACRAVPLLITVHGLFGVLCGSSIGLLHLCLVRMPRLLTWAVQCLTGAVAVYAFRDSWWTAATALVAVALPAIAALRRTGRMTLDVLLVPIALIVLAPLFSGRTMALTFSPGQSGLILSAVAALLLWILFLAAPQKVIVGARISPIRGAGALLHLIVLNQVSAVFLVRLWGFQTMEFLQNLVLVTQNLLALVVVRSMLPLMCRSDAYRGVPHRTARLHLTAVPLVAVLALAIGTPLGVLGSAVPAAFRFAPQGQLVLAHLRPIFDADGDGFSRLLTTSECDDRDPARNPLALDLPGDGLDGNCVGGDLQSVAHRVFNAPVDVTLPSFPPDRPRVSIFVLIDTLRADMVDYRAANNDTPTLALVAARSKRFLTAIAQSNNTLDSMPYVLHLGHRILPRYNDSWTLRSLLDKADVDSAVVLQGSLPEWWTGGFHEVLMGFRRTRRPEVGERPWTATSMMNRALSELKGPPEGNRFVYVHVDQLHNSFAEVMEGDRMIRSGMNVQEILSFGSPEKTAKVMRDRYRDSLKDIDRALLRLWKHVQDLEQTTDVQLIITSDHGEEFYDHGGFFHMGTLYNELLHVPLVIYETGSAPRVESRPVALNRVGATILHFLGFGGSYLETLSLRPEHFADTEIFAQFEPSGRENRRQVAVFEGDFKLIYDSAGGNVEMYNYVNDPQERHNLADAPDLTAVRAQLLAKVDTTLFFMNYGDLDLLRRRG